MAAVVSGPAEDQARLATEPQIFDADDHIDIEALLSRPRTLGRRRQRPLYKAPEFVKRLGAFEEVEVGKDVVFECQWKSFPKPEFQWFKDETNITHDPRYQVKEGDNGVLTLYIQRVTKKDEGTYKCRVENCEGSNSTTGDVKDKVLSAQPRRHAEHAVSFPPCLRTIIEQQSLEELEAEDYEPITPPSRADTWPLLGRSAPDCALQAIDNSLLLAERGQSALTPEGDKDDDSDTSVNSQGDLERVSFEAPPTEEVHPAETIVVATEIYPTQAERPPEEVRPTEEDDSYRVSFKRPLEGEEDVERVRAKVPLVYDASRVDDKAPLAGDDEFDSLSVSSQSTAEPELFTMDDIETKSRETSRSRESSISFDLRPPIPTNEPPRFNTPRLRTPTPPLLPRFSEDPHTRTPYELGPTLISETDIVPENELIARHVPIMPNTPTMLFATPPPKDDIVPEEPRQKLIRTSSLTIELINKNTATKEEQQDMLHSDTSDYGSTSSILSAYQDPMEYISPELRSLAEKTAPREEDWQTRGSVSECSNRERLLSVAIPHTPFPWTVYAIFALCCGFCGSIVDMSPSWFIMLVALLSMISFRYTISVQD